MSVAERDQPARVRGDVGLVRDEHDRHAALFVEPLEERHHVFGRRGVERAGRLVGEDQLRLRSRSSARSRRAAAVRRRAGSADAARTWPSPTASSASSAAAAPLRRPARRRRSSAARRFPSPSCAAAGCTPGTRSPSARERRSASASASSADDVVPGEAVRPDVGRSSRPTMCMNVDLPEPDGPITATNSPGSMVRSTPRSATTSSPPSMRVDLAQTAHVDDGVHRASLPAAAAAARRPPRWLPPPSGLRVARARRAAARAAVVAGHDLVGRVERAAQRRDRRPASSPTSPTLTGTGCSLPPRRTKIRPVAPGVTAPPLDALVATPRRSARRAAASPPPAALARRAGRAPDAGRCAAPRRVAAERAGRRRVGEGGERHDRRVVDVRDVDRRVRRHARDAARRRRCRRSTTTV